MLLGHGRVFIEVLKVSIYKRFMEAEQHDTFPPSVRCHTSPSTNGDTQVYRSVKKV